MNKDTIPPIDLRKFGELVRAARKFRGWSQEVLAATALSNLDRKGYISKVERGRQPNLTSPTVKSLATALDIDREEIPHSLRWPEANADIRPLSEIMQDVYEQVAALVGQGSDSAKEVGFRDGVLIALAKQYTGSTPEDFHAAVASLSRTMDRVMPTTAREQVPEGVSRDYQKLLAKLADIEIGLMENGYKGPRRPTMPVVIFSLIAAAVLTMSFPWLRSQYYMFIIQYFRPADALANLQSIDRYVDKDGVARSHHGLSAYEAAIYNRGRGLDAESDANAVQGLLNGCVNSKGLVLSALDLRLLSLDKIKDRCGRVNLSDVDLRSSALPRVEFPMDANLSRTLFSGAILVGANFNNAEVTGANFNCTDISGADFRNVRGLTEKQLSNAVCGYGSLCGPKLPEGVEYPIACRWIEDKMQENGGARCEDIPLYYAIDSGMHAETMRSCFRDHLTSQK